MVAPSRLPKITADQVFEGKTCGFAVHRWTENCTRASLYMAWSCFIGANKFFIPIYVAQLLVKNKNIDREYLKKQAKAYMKSILFGWFMGTTFLPVCCPLVNMVGFSHYLTVFVPALVGGLGIFFEHHHKRGFITCSYTGFCSELSLKQYPQPTGRHLLAKIVPACVDRGC
uniref:Transmembrane protein 135 N-terminal domain-containing protein n=1 Tax=Timema genevievae TaxID=629358 RepID=A0A7R9K1U6_TIMGE|nr:unnamed protein product [Timema genevievae]